MKYFRGGGTYFGADSFYLRSRIDVFVSVIYLTLIMSMTAASIVICVMVLNLHHRDNNAPVPSWLTTLSFRLLAPLVCMRKQVKEHDQNTSERPRSTQGLTAAAQTAADNQVKAHAHNTTARRAPHQHESSFTRDVKRRARRREIVVEILGHIELITWRLKEEEDEQRLHCDWMIVAKILDRFFLLVFVCLVTGSTSFLLVIYPNVRAVDP